jgi:hypothetical protein
MFNIKGILCEYLISKEEKKPSVLLQLGLFISAPSIFCRGTYGQSNKLAKKPRTPILRIFATVEK